MTTTKKDFEAFKAEFIHWQHKLGLTQYRVDFVHQDLSDDNNYACIQVQERDKVATVFFTTKIRPGCDAGYCGPEEQAKHEAIHLLLWRLSDLGLRRHLSEGDIAEEEEATVRRLEKVL